MNKETKKMAITAVIAALYAGLTYAAAAAGLAYGPVQFRFSEALTILPVFTGAAIPGLTIGCLLGNIFSGYGVVDMVVGTLASLIAAILTRKLRNVKFHGVPWLAPLPPILANAVLVGLEITLFTPETANLTAFLINAAEVGLGQLVICYGAGLPLYAAVNASPLKKMLAD